MRSLSPTPLTTDRCVGCGEVFHGHQLVYTTIPAVAIDHERDPIEFLHYHKLCAIDRGLIPAEGELV